MVVVNLDTLSPILAQNMRGVNPGAAATIDAHAVNAGACALMMAEYLNRNLGCLIAETQISVQILSELIRRESGGVVTGLFSQTP